MLDAPSTLPAACALRAALPAPADQADRLIALGVHEIAGLTPAALRDTAARVREPGALLVVHPDLAPASALAPLLEHRGKPGFVVADMIDVDAFAPIEQVEIPAARSTSRPASTGATPWRTGAPTRRYRPSWARAGRR